MKPDHGWISMDKNIQNYTKGKSNKSMSKLYIKIKEEYFTKIQNLVRVLAKYIFEYFCP